MKKNLMQKLDFNRKIKNLSCLFINNLIVLLDLYSMVMCINNYAIKVRKVRTIFKLRMRENHADLSDVFIK